MQYSTGYAGGYGHRCGHPPARPLHWAHPGSPRPCPCLLPRDGPSVVPVVLPSITVLPTRYIRVTIGRHAPCCLYYVLCHRYIKDSLYLSERLITTKIIGQLVSVNGDGAVKLHALVRTWTHVHLMCYSSGDDHLSSANSALARAGNRVLLMAFCLSRRIPSSSAI